MTVVDGDEHERRALRAQRLRHRVRPRRADAPPDRPRAGLQHRHRRLPRFAWIDRGIGQQHDQVGSACRGHHHLSVDLINTVDPCLGLVARLAVPGPPAHQSVHAPGRRNVHEPHLVQKRSYLVPASAVVEQVFCPP